jgi:hypothetical protein
VPKKKAKKKQAAKSKAAKPKAAKSKKALRARKPRKSTRKTNTLLGRGRSASRSVTQAGDLQGLRSTGTADSESVEELLEEGNAFEADAIAGVEEADEDQEREVHTREVPEDDVPEEYLDKD